MRYDIDDAETKSTMLNRISTLAAARNTEKKQKYVQMITLRFTTALVGSRTELRFQ